MKLPIAIGPPSRDEPTVQDIDADKTGLVAVKRCPRKNAFCTSSGCAVLQPHSPISPKDSLQERVRDRGQTLPMRIGFGDCPSTELLAFRGSVRQAPKMGKKDVGIFSLATDMGIQYVSVSLTCASEDATVLARAVVRKRTMTSSTPGCERPTFTCVHQDGDIGEGDLSVASHIQGFIS